jgi:CHAD domain-containing protein
LDRQAAAAARSQGADRVHDLRVAVRRFTQVLVAYRDALPRAAVKRIRRELKELMERAGVVRDFDIALRILRRCRLEGAAPLCRKLAAERTKSSRALAAALSGWKAAGSAALWGPQLAPVSPHGPISDDLEARARKFLAHGGAAAAGKASFRQLHRFRIEGKKLRYTIELLEPDLGAAGGEWLEKLKTMQTALGDVNDARMVRSHVKRFDAAPPVENWLKKRQRKKAREFAALWPQTFPEPQHPQLLAALHPPRRKPMARSAAGPVAVAQRA